MSGYTESIFSQSMAGFFHQSKSAILDNRLRQDLVSKARILLTKVPLAKAIIDVLTRGVVGSGLHTEDSGLEALSALRALDAAGELDFYQLQQQAWQTAVTCGEAFLLRSRNDGDLYSSWAIVEPDHIFNPPYMTAREDGNFYYKSHLLVDGIEFSSDGKPYAIWYCVEPYTRGFFNKKNWKRIFFKDKEGTRNIIHIRLTDRPEYPRGLPVLAPLIETLYGLYAYQSAQIQMGIVQSCQAFVVKTEENKSLNPFAGLTAGGLKGSLASRPETTGTAEEFSIIPPNSSDPLGLVNAANFIAPGQSYHLGVGESIEHLATTGPSNSLTEYYDLVLAQCASALGIPKAILSNVFDTSFSSCKASIAQWNFTISRYRKIFISQCLKPLYENYLIESGMDPEDVIKVTLDAEWKSYDPPLFADETRTMDFYARGIELGLVTRDEAALALFGHHAESENI